MSLLLRRRAILGTIPTGPVFSPGDLTGLIGWYRAAEEGLADGAAFATWTDLSPSGFDLAQPTSGSRPTAQTVSGLKVARFDGSADCIFRASTSMCGAGGHWSVFALAMTTTVAVGVAHVVDNDDEVGGGRLAQNIRRSGATSQALAFRTPPGANTDNGEALSAGVWHVLDAVRAASTVEMTVDGVSGGSTATTGTNATVGDCFTIGARDGGGTVSGWWAGDIAEVICLDHAADATEQANIRAYLTAQKP